MSREEVTAWRSAALCQLGEGDTGAEEFSLELSLTTVALERVWSGPVPHDDARATESA